MLVSVNCDCCGSQFKRRKYDSDYNIRLKRAQYCSRICAGKANFANIPEQKKNRSTTHLRGLNPRADQFTGFREYLIRARNRKHKQLLITLVDLKEQWIAQSGKCPYTGIELVHPTSKKGFKDKIRTASLDRIDSTKGYIKGNIQFVSMCINYFKNNMTHEQMIDVCKQIAIFWQNQTVNASTRYCSQAI